MRGNSTLQPKGKEKDDRGWSWYHRIRSPWPYVGTVVGCRRGVENSPAGGGIRIFPPGGGSAFCSRRGEGYF